MYFTVRVCDYDQNLGPVYREVALRMPVTLHALLGTTHRPRKTLFGLQETKINYDKDSGKTNELSLTGNIVSIRFFVR